jgi:ribosomal protein S18 acetylase RimI-like enzyme
MNNIKIINISLSKRTSSKIKAFEKKEWRISDIEHYGKAINTTKKYYKFVAKDKSNNIVGTLDLMIEANLAYIEALLVSSNHRRMGIGKRLLEQAEKFAKQKKCTKIWLETNEGWNAVDFYKKNDYKVTGKHENHFLNQKALIFTKYL